jgi:hypothetical protein
LDTDVTLLANEAAQFLVAFLPYLAPIGDAAADEIGTRAVGGAVGLAKKLWVRIRGGLPEPERIEEAAMLTRGPGEGPTSATVQQELSRQLLEALAVDPGLVKELREALGHPDTQPSEQNIGVQQTGPVFGGRVSGIGKQVNTKP